MNTDNWLSKKNIVIVLSILFLFITFPRIIFPDLDHGDEYSDAEVLSSGENFVRFGFIKTRFLQMHEPHLDKPENLYTHYPGLPDIINGFLRKVFKTDSLYFFRGASLLFAYFGVLLWYFFIKSVTSSNLISFLCAVFYLLNPMFIFGADSMHQLAYSDFLRSLILFTFVLMVDSSDRKKRGKFLILLWSLLLIQTWIGLDCIIYLFLFFGLYRSFIKRSGKPVSITTFLVLGSAPVAGLFLHLLQNAWYFGNFSLAFYDLKDSFLKRTIGGHELPQGLNFLAWFKYVILRNFSLVFYFDALVVSLSMFFAFLLYSKLSNKSREETKKLFYLLIIFIICGISWYVFFPSHSLAHAFVNFLPRHLVPAAAISFTIFTYIIYSFLKENNLWNNIYLRTSWLAIVSVILLTGVFKSELPITPDKIKRAQDFKIFTRCLWKLREISGAKDDIGVNYFRFPFIRYYTHRHCSAIFDKDSMGKLPTLPHYFIFIPYNDQKSQELFQFLQEKYTPLWQCDSSRFPAIFFKLKGD